MLPTMPTNDPVEVVITLSFLEDLLKPLSEVSPRLHVQVINARETSDIPAEIWGRVEVLYTTRVIPTPEEAPRLKWIQFHWAGADHATSAPILTRPGMQATTLSGASASQMAEHAVLMMLALGHHMPEAAVLQKRAEWPTDRWERFSPRELRGSTVGIIGYGSVGREVARLANEFGAAVLATKRDVMHPSDNGYIPKGLGDPNGDLVLRLYPPQALRSMLKECDFVVVCAPLTTETRNLLGAAELAELKPGAYLVALSRGGVIDYNALTPLLRDQKIGGAALDVFPTEPLPADSPLWKLPNVIITPHIAGFSPDYDQRAVVLFAENMQRYLAGLPLYNRIDIRKEY
jgi:phosphoglycerate dehydrogenase-like enzyme